MNRSDMRIQSVFPLALLAGWLISAAPAQAMPPLSREADGVICAIDQKNAVVTVKIRNEPRLRSFTWNRATEFVQRGEFVGPQVLKTGAAVRIRYRAPFFGKSFVSRVTLLDCSGSETATPRPKNTP